MGNTNSKSTSTPPPRSRSIIPNQGKSSLSNNIDKGSTLKVVKEKLQVDHKAPPDINADNNNNNSKVTTPPAPDPNNISNNTKYSNMTNDHVVVNNNNNDNSNTTSIRSYIRNNNNNESDNTSENNNTTRFSRIVQVSSAGLSNNNNNNNSVDDPISKVVEGSCDIKLSTAHVPIHNDNENMNQEVITTSDNKNIKDGKDPNNESSPGYKRRSDYDHIHCDESIQLVQGQKSNNNSCAENTSVNNNNSNNTITIRLGNNENNYIQNNNNNNVDNNDVSRRLNSTDNERPRTDHNYIPAKTQLVVHQQIINSNSSIDCNTAIGDFIQKTSVNNNVYINKLYNLDQTCHFCDHASNPSPTSAPSREQLTHIQSNHENDSPDFRTNINDDDDNTHENSISSSLPSLKTPGNKRVGTNNNNTLDSSSPDTNETVIVSFTHHQAASSNAKGHYIERTFHQHPDKLLISDIASRLAQDHHLNHRYCSNTPLKIRLSHGTITTTTLAECRQQDAYTTLSAFIENNRVRLGVVVYGTDETHVCDTAFAPDDAPDDVRCALLDELSPSSASANDGLPSISYILQKHADTNKFFTDANIKRPESPLRMRCTKNVHTLAEIFGSCCNGSHGKHRNRLYLCAHPPGVRGGGTGILGLSSAAAYHKKAGSMHALLHQLSEEWKHRNNSKREPNIALVRDEMCFHSRGFQNHSNATGAFCLKQATDVGVWAACNVKKIVTVIDGAKMKKNRHVVNDEHAHRNGAFFQVHSNATPIMNSIEHFELKDGSRVSIKIENVIALGEADTQVPEECLHIAQHDPEIDIIIQDTVDTDALVLLSRATRCDAVFLSPQLSSVGNRQLGETYFARPSEVKEEFFPHKLADFPGGKDSVEYQEAAHVACFLTTHVSANDFSSIMGVGMQGAPFLVAKAYHPQLGKWLENIRVATNRKSGDEDWKKLLLSIRYYIHAPTVRRVYSPRGDSNNDDTPLKTDDSYTTQVIPFGKTFLPGTGNFCFSEFKKVIDLLCSNLREDLFFAFNDTFSKYWAKQQPSFIKDYYTRKAALPRPPNRAKGDPECFTLFGSLDGFVPGYSINRKLYTDRMRDAYTTVKANAEKVNHETCVRDFFFRHLGARFEETRRLSRLSEDITELSGNLNFAHFCHERLERFTDSEKKTIRDAVNQFAFASNRQDLLTALGPLVSDENNNSSTNETHDDEDDDENLYDGEDEEDENENEEDENENEDEEDEKENEDEEDENEDEEGENENEDEEGEEDDEGDEDGDENDSRNNNNNNNNNNDNTNEATKKPQLTIEIPENSIEDDAGMMMMNNNTSRADHSSPLTTIPVTKETQHGSSPFNSPRESQSAFDDASPYDDDQNNNITDNSNNMATEDTISKNNDDSQYNNKYSARQLENKILSNEVIKFVFNDQKTLDRGEWFTCCIELLKTKLTDNVVNNINRVINKIIPCQEEIRIAKKTLASINNITENYGIIGEMILRRHIRELFSQALKSAHTTRIRTKCDVRNNFKSSLIHNLTIYLDLDNALDTQLFKQQKAALHAVSAVYNNPVDSLPEGHDHHYVGNFLSDLKNKNSDFSNPNTTIDIIRRNQPTLSATMTSDKIAAIHQASKSLEELLSKPAYGNDETSAISIDPRRDFMLEGKHVIISALLRSTAMPSTRHDSSPAAEQWRKMRPTKTNNWRCLASFLRVIAAGYSLKCESECHRATIIGSFLRAEMCKKRIKPKKTAEQQKVENVRRTMMEKKRLEESLATVDGAIQNCERIAASMKNSRIVATYGGVTSLKKSLRDAARNALALLDQNPQEEEKRSKIEHFLDICDDEDMKKLKELSTSLISNINAQKEQRSDKSTATQADRAKVSDKISTMKRQLAKFQPSVGWTDDEMSRKLQQISLQHHNNYNNNNNDDGAEEDNNIVDVWKILQEYEEQKIAKTVDPTTVKLTRATNHLASALETDNIHATSVHRKHIEDLQVTNRWNAAELKTRLEALPGGNEVQQHLVDFRKKYPSKFTTEGFPIRVGVNFDEKNDDDDNQKPKQAHIIRKECAEKDAEEGIKDENMKNLRYLSAMLAAADSRDKKKSRRGAIEDLQVKNNWNAAELNKRLDKLGVSSEVKQQLEDFRKKYTPSKFTPEGLPIRVRPDSDDVNDQSKGSKRGAAEGDDNNAQVRVVKEDKNITAIRKHATTLHVLLKQQKENQQNNGGVARYENNAERNTSNNARKRATIGVRKFRDLLKWSDAQLKAFLEKEFPAPQLVDGVDVFQRVQASKAGDGLAPGRPSRRNRDSEE